MNRDRSLFRHFGLNADALYWGSAHQSYGTRVQDAVESRRMIAVVGSFGSGKSHLVREALTHVDRLEVVYVNNPDRERLRIGQIVSAMITVLSDDTPRRDNMARCFQLARVVGEKVVVNRREVVVVIENAHRLHSNTLLALKDLRESTIYKGRDFLFSVVLVGQEPLRGKLDRFGEVAYRTLTIDLDRNGWMSIDERREYLRTIYRDVIDEKTRNRLATLFETPLRMDAFVEEKLTAMRDAGLTRLDESVMPLSVHELRTLLKLSVRELERVSGVPKSTISDVESGRNQDEATTSQLLAALDRIAAERESDRPGLRRVGS